MSTVLSAPSAIGSWVIGSWTLASSIVEAVAHQTATAVGADRDARSAPTRTTLWSPDSRPPGKRYQFSARYRSAASSSSLAECSRAWWLQNSNSPPLGRTARTAAAAPHRSHRSAAVSAAGLASVPVMSSSHLRPPDCGGLSVPLFRRQQAPVCSPRADAFGHIQPAANWCSVPQSARTGATVREDRCHSPRRTGAAVGAELLVSTRSWCHASQRIRSDFARGERQRPFRNIPVTVGSSSRGFACAAPAVSAIRWALGSALGSACRRE